MGAGGRGGKIAQIWGGRLGVKYRRVEESEARVYMAKVGKTGDKGGLGIEGAG